MKKTAHGPFEVHPKPLPADEISQKIGAMRMSFDKKFSGALDATGIVSMIGILDQELGSGGYVAMERITGTLDGRKGSFCVQHSCTMTRGKPEQSILIVPDTGTDELEGLAGEFKIDIRGEDHFYNLEYSLAAAPT